MRVQAYSGSASQKAIVNQETLFMRNFINNKIKKDQSPSRKDVKSFKKESVNSEDEYANTTAQSSPKLGGILPVSKKIKKTKRTSSRATKKTQKEINNQHKEPAKPYPLRTLRSGKVFLEDGSRQTCNYGVLNYTNTRTNTSMDFICFKDRDLNIPLAFTDKLIPHSHDNDCYTDEDQVASGVRSLLTSLKECIKEESESKPEPKPLRKRRTK